jgi:predicted transcriptional regulator
MGNFVPPFTYGVLLSTSVPSSPLPSVRLRLDDRNVSLQNLSREQPCGMPTLMIENIQNNASMFADQVNPFTMHNAHSPSSSRIFGRNCLPALSTESMRSLRQQMDESNHELVNLLTEQIGTVFNPLIQDTSRSYQALAPEMGRITDFFAPPQPIHQPIPQVRNPQPLRLIEPMVQRPQLVPQPRPIEPVVQVQTKVVLVNRNHDAYEVVRNVQQQNIGEHNNIANLVENIMAQNGLNIALRRPNFVSPLSDLVFQFELPRGYKIPKFTKFAGDTVSPLSNILHDI